MTTYSPWHHIRTLSAVLMCTTVLTAVTGRFVYAQQVWSDPESRHAVISRIEIRVHPVFDLENPKENHFVGRAANFIHVETRAESIRPALLFKVGEPVDALRIHASERLLRRMPFVRDAEILPVENPDGTVIAIVEVRDAWSLKPHLALSHAGGQTEWSVSAREFNVLGLGKQVQIGYDKTIDRSLTDFAYQDPLLLHTRWMLFAEYQDLSDGIGRYLVVQHPFHDVHAPWSAGIAANSLRSTQTFYEKGKPVYHLPSRRYSLSLFYRFRVWRGERSALRSGLEYLATGHRYDSLTVFRPDILPFPETRERRLHGVMSFWQFFQDAHIARCNINFVEVVEDFNLGWDAQVWLGHLLRSQGRLSMPVYTEGSIAKGLAPDQSSFALGHVLWRGGWEETGIQHMWYQSELAFFGQHLPLQTCVVSLQHIRDWHPFPEDVVYLGGTDGLRGYMNHFRIGNERWMLTVEDRIFTPWDFWGIVELGFVSYLDAGGVKDLSTDRWSRSYASAGGGLRIGNLKSSIGRVMSLTVAAPIVREPGVKGVQILLVTGE
jgi:hypothetical protein